jgi:hypothetical protein
MHGSKLDSLWSAPADEGKDATIVPPRPETSLRVIGL